VAVGERASELRAADGEVDVGHGARQPGVVKHRRDVQELAVERDPVQRGQRRAPRVRAARVVEQGGAQEVLGRRLGIPGERGVPGREACRIDSFRRPECRRSVIAGAITARSPHRAGAPAAAPAVSPYPHLVEQ
jgi:hypothetical protein